MSLKITCTKNYTNPTVPKNGLGLKMLRLIKMFYLWNNHPFLELMIVLQRVKAWVTNRENLRTLVGWKNLRPTMEWF